MASIEFILCKQDIETISNAIERIGLKVLFNKRYVSCEIEYEPAARLDELASATVYLTKDEWKFGSYQFTACVNTVTKEPYFDLSPCTNFTALSLSYYPMREDRGVSQLGWGDVDSFSTWLKMPEKTLQSAPSDMEKTYREFLRVLQIGGKIIRSRKGGVIVMKHALVKFRRGTHVMPHAWLDGVARDQIPSEPE